MYSIQSTVAAAQQITSGIWFLGLATNTLNESSIEELLSVTSIYSNSNLASLYSYY